MAAIMNLCKLVYLKFISYPRGGGVLALEMGGGVPLACSNLILSQFASRLKRLPVPIFKLTQNLIAWFMVWLLPIYFMFFGLFKLGNICLENFWGYLLLGQKYVNEFCW